MDLPEEENQMESGLNQRDRATGGFGGVHTSTPTESQENPTGGALLLRARKKRGKKSRKNPVKNVVADWSKKRAQWVSKKGTIYVKSA